MKKLLIGMLITCSLGLVACGTTNTETPSNNNADVGITDGTNGNGASNGNEVTDGTNGTNGNGSTDGTNSNQNGTNNQGSSLSETKTSLNNLYTEFKGKVEGGVENVNAEDWGKYSTEFKGKVTNLRNTIDDTSMRGTLDDIENLFNEYDTSIKEKKDVSKEKIQEMQKKIDDQLK